MALPKNSSIIQCPHCGKDINEPPMLALQGEDVHSPVVELPLLAGKFYPVFEDDFAKFAQAYPAIDLNSEMARLAAWLHSNPKKRPKSDMLRFVNRWLTRAQNNAGGRDGKPFGYQAERAQIARVIARGD